MKGLFVTGSGTGIGKTYVACRLIEALRARGIAVGALKPVVTGYAAEDAAASDPGRLAAALGLPPTGDAVEAIAPFRFAAPLSPHMAAAREGRRLDVASLAGVIRRAAAGSTLTLIEGAGGVMVPLNEAETTLDLMAALGLPCLLVTGSYLGALSHGLTAAKVLEIRRLRCLAVLVNESEGSDVPLEEMVQTMRRLLAPLPVLSLCRDARGEDPAMARLADDLYRELAC